MRNAGTKTENWDDYKELILEDLEDFDYTFDSDLRDRTLGDFEAAAMVLWEQGKREVDVRELLAMSKRQTGCYMDDNHIASERRQGFMDLADRQGLSSTLLDRISSEVAHDILHKLPEGGEVGVRSDHGIYVFRTGKPAPCPASEVTES